MLFFRYTKVIECFALMGIALMFVGCGRENDETTTVSSATVNEDISPKLEDKPFWTVTTTEDNALSKSHPLYPYFLAAKAKQLPTKFFRDLIRLNKDVNVKKADWPHYSAGVFWGGTIYHPEADSPPQTWASIEWPNFYNELFHAWWGNVFMLEHNYASLRKQLLTAERREKYKLAAPWKPLLAQEEAYSETISDLTFYMRTQYSGHAHPSAIPMFFALSTFGYNIHRTVSAVGHSDRPGFTPAAENIYPDREEYRVIFSILTDSNPPEATH